MTTMTSSRSKARSAWFVWVLMLSLCAPVALIADDDDEEAEESGFFERLFSGFSDDDDDDEEEAAQLEYIDGRAAIRLSEELAERAGIETATLSESQQAKALGARALVLPQTELLDARQQDQQLKIRADAARQQIGIHDEVLRDLRALTGRSRPPKQRFREAELARRSAAAQFSELQAAREALALKLRLRWGSEVALMALNSKDGAVLETWLRDNAVLVLSLPPGQFAPAAMSESIVGLSVGSAEREARVLGPAMGREEANTESWLILADSRGLRPGMWVAAKINTSDQSTRTGVSVPASAVIWHYGKPWMYLRNEEGVYLRTPLGEHEVGDEAWFVAGPDLAGRELVVRGAQVLLSEESRWNIPAEDDDD